MPARHAFPACPAPLTTWAFLPLAWVALLSTTWHSCLLHNLFFYFPYLPVYCLLLLVLPLPWYSFKLLFKGRVRFLFAFAFACLCHACLPFAMSGHHSFDASSRRVTCLPCSQPAYACLPPATCLFMPATSCLGGGVGDSWVNRMEPSFLKISIT